MYENHNNKWGGIVITITEINLSEREFDLLQIEG